MQRRIFYYQTLKIMKPNATALANHFIDLAMQNNVELRQFGLMKRVYIAHGFCLAMLNKSALNPRFDWVEAWSNGPVIPSVYHSFKYNRNNAIKEKTVISIFEGTNIRWEEPILEDKEIKIVANAVWERYKDYTDFQLIEMLHQKGSPWDAFYEDGKNNLIPDDYTQIYYQKLLNYGRIAAGIK